MKSLCVVSGAILVLFQGCSDSSSDTTAAPSTVPPTTAVPVSTEPLPTCEKISAKGFMTIRTEYNNGGFSISSTTCDLYKTFNEDVLDETLVNLGSGSGFHGASKDILKKYISDGVQIKVGHTAFDYSAGKELFSAASSFVEEAAIAVEKVTSRIADALFDDKAAKELHFMLKLNDTSTENYSAEDFFTMFRDLELEETLSMLLIEKLTARDLIFPECNMLLGFVADQFMGNSDVDAFCDPQASLLAAGQTCKIEAQDIAASLDLVVAETGGWSIKSAVCHGSENSEVPTYLNFEWATKSAAGTFYGDAAVHRTTCEELSNKVAYEGCLKLPGNCTHASTNGNFEVMGSWNSTVAEIMEKEYYDMKLKYDKDDKKDGPGEKEEGDYEKKDGPGEKEEGDYEKKDGPGEKEDGKEGHKDGFKKEFLLPAFNVTSLSCKAYPSIMDELATVILKDMPCGKEDMKKHMDTMDMGMVVNGTLVTNSTMPMDSMEKCMKYMDLTVVNITYSSCTQIKDTVAYALGQPDLDAFCDPEMKLAHQNSTAVCSLASKDDMYQIGLEMAVGTWNVTSANCTASPSAEGMSMLTDAVAKFARDTAVGDAFHRRTCENHMKYSTKLVEMLEEVCKSTATTTTAAPDAASTTAPPSDSNLLL